MSLRDLGLEIKLGAKNAGRSTVNQARRLKPVQAAATTAAKYSNMEAKVAMDPDKLILDILKLIDEATKSGYYVVGTKIPAFACQKIAEYMTKKGFIVATNNKRTALAICWMGGDMWRKLNYGNAQVTDQTKKDLKKVITAACTQQLLEADKKVTGIKWLNPKKDTVDNFTKLWRKLK